MSRSLYAMLHREFGPKVDAVTRRQMLKAGLAASAGLLLSNSLPPALAAQAKKGKRVVIVGAGFSGLACAHELIAAGYDVTIVEASNRVGGRVLSFGDFIPGKNVEGGGELVGSNHPTWMNYAEKFGLKFWDVTEDEQLEYPIVIAGKRLDKAAGGELWEALDEALAKMNADAEPIDADQPWNSPNAAKLDERNVADWIAKLDTTDHCKAAITAQLAGDNGVATDKQSYLGMLTAVKGGGLDKYWSDSEIYRCKGGNDQVAKKLAEAIGKDRVIIGLPVSKIAISGDRVVVTCRDGRMLECDDVVLTAAPSVWDKFTIEPALPSFLKPQMGVNIKYLTHVKKRFWLGSGVAPVSLTDEDISWIWESTEAQEGDENAGLTCFSGGPAAEKMRARRGEALKQAYHERIEKIYPGFNENFVRDRFMDWPGQTWTMAGYSFPAPGQVTKIGPFLYSGHAKHLHFAGEHTSYKFVGYMEGALNSGVSLARRLAVRDGVTK